MAKEICGKTAVTINGAVMVCDNFPQVWEVLENNGYSIDEKTKEYLIRILFINGEYKHDDNLSFEIVWEN